MSSSTESAAVGRIKSSAASGRISNIEFVSQLAANRMSSILLPEHHYNVSSPVVQIYAEDTSEQQDITEGGNKMHTNKYFLLKKCKIVM